VTCSCFSDRTWKCCHGKTGFGQCGVEMDRAVAASADEAAQTESWPQADDKRRALSGILFVLQTGIPWERLPEEPDWGVTAPSPMEDFP